MPRSPPNLHVSLIAHPGIPSQPSRYRPTETTQAIATYGAIMAVLSSTLNVPIGADLPNTTLPDLLGNEINLGAYRETRALLVIFACNHCPYVRHLEVPLRTLISEFSDAELAAVAISSNDVDQYPDDDIAGLSNQCERADWNFPYLVDSDQSAAKAFNTACTPDFFLYDRDGRLAYRGAFDASTPKNNEPLTGDLLRRAIEAVLAGHPVPEPHRPALGCGIKWKPGNAPESVLR